MSPDSHSLAFFLSGAAQKDNDIYAMINAGWNPLRFVIQQGQPREWHRVIDTNLPSPADFCEPDAEVSLETDEYVLSPRSIVVLVR
jgi:isoamylase